MNMNEVKAIEAITKDILSGLYGSIQSAGTETQKYTYAYLQAKEIFNGNLIIDLENGFD
tara:strand:+ start:651 stop:827 length:177 start_codon:yes stop_codon:yes gene_type:complete